MDKEVVRILLNHYTKIGYNGGIAKVIFDDEFEIIAEEIVKLFLIPPVIKSVCDSFRVRDNYKENQTCERCSKYPWEH